MRIIKSHLQLASPLMPNFAFQPTPDGAAEL